MRFVHTNVMYLNFYVRDDSMHIKKILCCTVLILCTVAGIFIFRSFSVSTNNLPDDCISLPILMYHAVNSKKSSQGKFVISPEEFEQDLENIKKNSFTTIFMQDVIDYVYDNKELPERPLVITFDDGYYNNYMFAYPLLEKHNLKAVISPIGKYADLYTKEKSTNPNYAHATWENLKEMQSSGLVEIQNHSYNMHTMNGNRNGTKKRRGESFHDYKMAFTEDVGLMQKRICENLGTTPQVFTYPFGAISDCSVEILKGMGFRATLGCENKINKISKNPECLYGLGRLIREHGVSSEKFFRTKVLKLT